MTRWDRLEPEAVATQNINNEPYMISIAVSLKRIADVLENNLGHNATAHDGTLLAILNGVEMNGRT